MLNVEYTGSGKYCYTVDSLEEKDLLPTTNTDATGVFENVLELQQRPAIGSTCYAKDGGKLVSFMLFSDGWCLL